MQSASQKEVFLFIVHDGSKYEPVGSFPNREEANRKIADLGTANATRLLAIEGISLSLGLIDAAPLVPVSRIKVEDKAASLADAPYGLKKDGTPRKPPGRKNKNGFRSHAEA